MPCGPLSVGHDREIIHSRALLGLVDVLTLSHLCEGKLPVVKPSGSDGLPLPDLPLGENGYIRERVAVDIATASEG